MRLPRFALLACDVLAIAIVVFVAAVLVWHARYAPQIGYDESAAWLGFRLIHDLSFGNDIDPGGVIGFQRGVFMDVYPPAYYMISSLVFLVAGFGIEQARWTTIMLVCLTALLCYVAGRRLVGPAAGFLALAIYLTIPIAIFPISSRPDAAVPFFIIATLWLLSEALIRNLRPLFGAAGAAYGVAILSHWIALLAGPAVALLLWRIVGPRFWRSRKFWVFFVGWAVPFTAYWTTAVGSGSGALSAILHYRTVGAPGTTTWSTWPLSAVLAHWSALCQLAVWYRTFVLCATVLPLFLLLPPLRNRVPPTLRLWLPLPSLLAGLVSLYPNIAVYGYYAPLYLAPLAVTTGLCVALFPARLAGITAVLALCIACASASELLNTARAQVAKVGHIPVATALEFFGSLSTDPTQPVLGLAHWVFAASAHRLQSFTALRTNAGGMPEFPGSLRALVPRYRPIAEIPTIILDGAGESFLFLESLTYRTANAIARGKAPDQDFDRPSVLGTGFRDRIRRRVLWKIPDLRTAGDRELARTYVATIADLGLIGTAMDVRESAIFSNPASASASYTVFQKQIGTAMWPRLGIATPSGPAGLTIDPHCHRTVALRVPLSPSSNGLHLRRLSFSLPAEVVQPVLVRIVVAKGSGFVSAFSQPWEAESAMTSIANGDSISTVSLDSLGFRLPTGEWGRDILLTGTRLTGGTLVIASVGANTIERVEIALPKRVGQQCTSADGKLLHNLVAQVSGPEPAPLVRSPFPRIVTAGSNLELSLSARCSGLLQVWQGGHLVFSRTFSDRSAIPVNIPNRGEAAIELYIDASGNPRRLGFFQFVDAD